MIVFQELKVKTKGLTFKELKILTAMLGKANKWQDTYEIATEVLNDIIGNKEVIKGLSNHLGNISSKVVIEQDKDLIRVFDYIALTNGCIVFKFNDLARASIAEMLEKPFQYKVKTAVVEKKRPIKVAVGKQYKHTKSGKIVKVIAIAREEKTLKKVVVYNEKDSGFWTRPMGEFRDGRFKEL